MRAQVSIEYLAILGVMIMLFYAISMNALNNYVPKVSRASILSVISFQNKTLYEMAEELEAFDSGCINTTLKVPPFCKLQPIIMKQPVKIVGLYYNCTQPIGKVYSIGKIFSEGEMEYYVNGQNYFDMLKEGEVFNVSICK